MKNLDQIINNERHVRLSKQLSEQSITLAGKVRQAMDSAGIKEVADLEIRTVRSHSGFSDTSLYIISDGERPVSLEHSCSSYIANDYNAYIPAANNTDRLNFLNEVRDVLKTIDEMKETECNTIEVALNGTKNLLEETKF